MQNSPYCCCVFQFSHHADVCRQAAHGMWLAADTVTARRIQLSYKLNHTAVVCVRSQISLQQTKNLCDKIRYLRGRSTLTFVLVYLLYQ